MKRMRRIFEIQFLVLLSTAGFAQNVEIRNARYFEVGKITDQPLYTQHISIETSAAGDRIWNSEIKDDTGSVVISETAQIHDNKVVSQTISNNQSKETCELQVGADKATYRTYRYLDGKRGDLIEQKDRPKEDNFVTGPAVEFYLIQRWDQLLAGQSIDVEFGIFELMRSIGFRLKKEGETESLLKVKMKASNFFISLLLDPIHLEFDKATKRLVHYKGRTPLRRSRGGSLKPWDAEIVYEPVSQN